MATYGKHATKIIYAGDLDFFYGPAHDGVGWYWVDAEYPEDSGAVGRFDTMQDVLANIRGSYQPDFGSDFVPRIGQSWVNVHPHDLPEAFEMDSLYNPQTRIALPVILQPRREPGALCRWSLSDDLPHGWTHTGTVIRIPGRFDGLTTGQCHAMWQANRAALERGCALTFNLTPEQIAAAKACL